MIVVTFDRRRSVERLLHNAREENPNLSSIVSATDDRDIDTLVAGGAGTVFPENFAAGLALADQVLLMASLKAMPHRSSLLFEPNSVQH
jgi:CPA2 family monovalent cation:H+ antiporter-2